MNWENNSEKWDWYFRVYTLLLSTTKDSLDLLVLLNLDKSVSTYISPHSLLKITLPVCSFLIIITLIRPLKSLYRDRSIVSGTVKVKH